MAPQVPETARAVVGKARETYAKIRPGDTSGRRALPIRGSGEEIEAAWRDPAGRAAVLAGLAVAEASIDVGEQDRDFGRTVTLSLQLEAAVPSMATQLLAGKAVRRLKALVETGEVPTTDHNPAYRADAGEEALA
ncbi:MAG: hypothetical protein JWQ18_1382 [Conexibacter sp.]|nr:hypothetical protein [Conexibacter sp.]